MALTMEEAIALVREHDERSGDYTITLSYPNISETHVRHSHASLMETIAELLHELTGEKPTDEQVEQSIYG